MSTLSYVGGLHAVKALLESDVAGIEALHVQRGRRDARLRTVLDLAVHNSVPVHEISRSDLNQLAANSEHQGVLAQYRDKPLGSEAALHKHLSGCQTPWLILVLDEIQDPHNLGACLRSADATGVNAVVITANNSVGLTPVVRKVASGAAESVALFQVSNLQRALQKLQATGVWVYGAVGETETQLYQVDWSGSVAVVMGAEGRGIRRLTRQTCDGLFAIPMLGAVSSLNVSVATGVTLFEICRQRRSG